MQLSTGRTVYQWHTRTKTGRVRQLNEAAPDVWIELCREDAASLGIAEGDVVLAESRRGSIECKARVTGSRPGVVFVPFHYGYFDTSGAAPDGPGTAANEMTRTEWDPVSKQPIFKVTAVRVSKSAASDGTPSPAPLITTATGSG